MLAHPPVDGEKKPFDQTAQPGGRDVLQQAPLDEKDASSPAESLVLSAKVFVFS
jgi:hypothetical protein